MPQQVGTKRNNNQSSKSSFSIHADRSQLDRKLTLAIRYVSSLRSLKLLQGVLGDLFRRQSKRLNVTSFLRVLASHLQHLVRYAAVAYAAVEVISVRKPSGRQTRVAALSSVPSQNRANQEKEGNEDGIDTYLGQQEGYECFSLQELVRHWLVESGMVSAHVLIQSSPSPNFSPFCCALASRCTTSASLGADAPRSGTVTLTGKTNVVAGAVHLDRRRCDCPSP